MKAELICAVLMRDTEGQVVFYSPKALISNFTETETGYTVDVRDIQDTSQEEL